MAKKRLSARESRAVIKTLLSYLRGYKAQLALSFITAFLAVVCTIIFPYITGRAIDAIGEGAYFTFFSLVVVLIALALFSALMTLLMNRANNRMSYSIVKDIRRRAFNHLQSLPLSYLDSKPHGDLVARIITDTEQISDGLLMGFTQLFSGVLTIVGTLCCLFYINWIVALVVLLVTPLSLFTASFIAKKTFDLFSMQSRRRGEQTAYIDEMITGVGVIEAFSREERTKEGFDRINDEWARVSLSATFYSSLTNPLTRFVNALVYAGVALSGGLSALYGRLTVGALTATLSYASQYTKPFNEITGVMTELQNALASAERVFALLDEMSEISDASNEPFTSCEGYVRADDVSFSYNKEEKLLEHLSFEARKGMKVAIVGPTGCGKTTIINLLMRFYDVDSGSIRVDGRDIRELRRRDLRESYGMVLQETWLKTGTIRENLTYANRNATEEEIRRAVKRCHLEQFIASLPLGYDEILSDESDQISQGQKQLLCIARVMLANPVMLILDEATSSIDTRTELIIQEAFSQMMKGKTSFIVAHRLSTIRSADLILVMKDGNIIEMGSHDELLKFGGFYNELYNSQFAK